MVSLGGEGVSTFPPSIYRKERRKRHIMRKLIFATLLLLAAVGCEDTPDQGRTRLEKDLTGLWEINGNGWINFSDEAVFTMDDTVEGNWWVGGDTIYWYYETETGNAGEGWSLYLGSLGSKNSIQIADLPLHNGRSYLTRK